MPIHQTRFIVRSRTDGAEPSVTTLRYFRDEYEAGMLQREDMPGRCLQGINHLLHCAGKMYPAAAFVNAIVLIKPLLERKVNPMSLMKNFGRPAAGVCREVCNFDAVLVQ